MIGGLLTIYTLESATRRDVDIVTVRTEQLDGIISRNIHASTRDDIASYTVHTRARPKDPAFVFLRLEVHTLIRVCAILGQREGGRGGCKAIAYSAIYTLKRETPRTIACRPMRVRIYRWCTSPYNISADDSTMDTSGIFDVSSSSNRTKGQ